MPLTDRFLHHAHRHRVCCPCHPSAADLHDDVLHMPCVRHVRLNADIALPVVQGMLAGQQLELLCCDMNCHPLRVSEVIDPLLPLLKPGACQSAPRASPPACASVPTHPDHPPGHAAHHAATARHTLLCATL